MPLQYTTGTINQPDAGSVGLSMVERIRDDLVAHAAWELVEEFTPASGAVRWYVFRCLSGVSGLPANFYVVIGRTLATGELRFCICEDYNAAAHTMSFFPRSSALTGSPYDASGRDTTTFVLSTAAFGASSLIYQNWTPGGTSTKWWLIVDDDGFTVAFNGSSNAFVHVGAFIPLTAVAFPMPLQIVGYNNTKGGITRNPVLAGIPSAIGTPPLQIEGGGSSPGSYGPILGFPGDMRYNDKLQNNQRAVAEQGITMDSSSDSRLQNGWALGKQKRWRLGVSPPAGVAFGDAYAMNGTLWVPYLPTDSRLWDTGVASS